MSPADRHLHDWADSVGAYLLEALPDDERAGFEAHLRECPVCQEDVAMLRVASDALPASVDQVSPPPELRSRIMAVVEAEAELMAAASGRRADLPDPVREPGWRGWLGRLTARPAYALAAVLLLLIAGGISGAVISGGPGDDARTVAGKVDTRLAETATAKLVIHDADSKLTVTDMPSPPEGRVYQVWLKHKNVANPQPTSALFVPRTDGSGSVVVPGSLRDVEAVLVTDEPEGGSQKPTRQPVITAATA